MPSSLVASARLAGRLAGAGLAATRVAGPRAGMAVGATPVAGAPEETGVEPARPTGGGVTADAGALAAAPDGAAAAGRDAAMSGGVTAETPSAAPAGHAPPSAKPVASSAAR